NKTSTPLGYENGNTANDSSSTTTHDKKIKYKFFVPKKPIIIKQRNKDLAEYVELLDDNNEKVSRQSSEYSRLKISCDHQNIVITNNTINFLSENGTYNIDVEYYGQIKHFQIF
ncbi:hypothetical protein SHY70_13200, partial [Streptococcus suis]|nr:hypothetical protein [Streptococcus suis]